MEQGPGPLVGPGMGAKAAERGPLLLWEVLRGMTGSAVQPPLLVLSIELHVTVTPPLALWDELSGADPGPDDVRALL